MNKRIFLFAAAGLMLSACSVSSSPNYAQSLSSRDSVDGRRAFDILNNSRASTARNNADGQRALNILNRKHAKTTVLASKVKGGISPEHIPLLLAAEQGASGKVRSVLTQGRVMALFNKEVIRGGCWDYLDTVFTRAGVPRQARKTVYKGASPKGPYASPDQLRGGDWIYHINHSYKNVQHSGMFIGWVDKERHLGLTLSYAGEGRNDPARYKVYDLSSVYNIMRAE